MDAPFREQAEGGRRIDGGGSAGQKSGEVGTPRLEARSAGPDAWADPQLAWREVFQWKPHPAARWAVVDSPPYRMTRSRGSYDWGGPTYGQHSYDVLNGMLGYDAERIAELAVAEALE